MRLSTVATLTGAAGSLVFLLSAGQRPSWLLLIIMMLWVIAPFAALGFAEVISKRWPDLVRKSLDWLSVLLPLGSLAAYAYDAWRPPHAQAAFVFVAAPLVAWVLMAITVSVAALIARRRTP